MLTASTSATNYILNEGVINSLDTALDFVAKKIAHHMVEAEYKLKEKERE